MVSSPRSRVFWLRMKQCRILLSMWIMAILPTWFGLTFVLESVFLDHQGTFNYEVEQNTVLTNVTCWMRIESISPLRLVMTNGEEVSTIPSSDGLDRGYAFPNISFNRILAQHYLEGLPRETLTMDTTCVVTVQTRAMLAVARYGYLTGTVRCSQHDENKRYFIHAARLLPTAPFGDNAVLNRFVGMSELNHLSEPAKIGIANKQSDLDQMDGFVIIDMDKYSAFAQANDGKCSQSLGAFGAKKEFCPVSCAEEEGVAWATWDATIYRNLPFSHSLRSFH